METRLKEFLVILSILNIVFLPGVTIAKAVELSITGNGSDSENVLEIAVDNALSVEQNNTSLADNSVEAVGVSGENSASGNTSGDVLINSGQVEQRIILDNKLNNSYVESDCCRGENEVKIAGNGSSSQNTIQINFNKSDKIQVDSEINLNNGYASEAMSGGNSSDFNTASKIKVGSGDISLASSIQNDNLNNSLVIAKAGFGDKSIGIYENGGGSKNEIDIDDNQESEVFINSSAEIENTAILSAVSGINAVSDNTASDIQIQTGHISLNTIIENLANIGGVEIDCCEIEPFDPGENDDKEEESDDEEDGDDNDTEDDNGEGDDGDDEDGEGGELLSEAASTEADVFGLSDTSSSSRPEYFWLGLAMIIIGGKLVTDICLPKASDKNA